LKVVFLYMELAGYITACLKAFVQKYPQAEVHLVRYPVNHEAPFEFGKIKKLFYYNRHDFTLQELEQLIAEIKPSCIMCSGWTDKVYLASLRKFKNKTRRVLVMDNQWKGGIKQQILRVASPILIRNSFDAAWVPGPRQVDYALKIGFQKDEVASGFYCGDVELFTRFYHESMEEKQITYPKHFICVARYIPSKNLEMLWNAFISLYDKGMMEDRKLICLGTGELFDNRIQHPAIEHIGFVQPQNMLPWIKESGVFVLPSLFEPWGVVVHEFACAGLPMLLSNQIGSGASYLTEGVNGFTFDAQDIESLKSLLWHFTQLSDNQLRDMGHKSHQMGIQTNTDLWVDTLHTFMN
jgi:glycosyltransferase involved in cell wall biosynthesis